MSLYKNQKAIKPKIENVAGNFVHQKNMENLNDFLGFLTDSKLKPQWASGNSWAVKYRSKTVCHIKFDSMSWFIMFSKLARENWLDGYNKYFTDNEAKKFVWENVKGPKCPRDCKGNKITFFGEEFSDVCSCWAIRAENPDRAGLEGSKKLILAIKDIITDLALASKV